MGEIGSNVR